MSIIANFIAKRRRLHQARTVCQLRFSRRARCAICHAKIDGGSRGRTDEALCHPLGCQDHPCHAFCMLALLGSDQPVGTRHPCPGHGCDRQFDQLCFHRAWWGRCSGQQSLHNLAPEQQQPDGGDEAVEGEVDDAATAAPHHSDGDEVSQSSAGGSERREWRLPAWMGSKLLKHKQQRKSKAAPPGQLSLDNLASECAICCCQIEGKVGVPDCCCHSFCLACLKRWCQTSATCPMDRKLVAFVYKRPTPGARRFVGRYRIGGSGADVFEASPPAPAHFSETAGGVAAAAAAAASSGRPSVPSAPPPPLEPSAPPPPPNHQSTDRLAAPPYRAGGGGLCSGMEASLLFLALLIGVTTALFVRRYGSPLWASSLATQEAAASTAVARLVALMKSYRTSLLVCIVQAVILLALLFRPLLRLLCWLCDRQPQPVAPAPS